MDLVFIRPERVEVGECSDNDSQGTITAPTGREVLVSLGTLAIGIAAGATRSAPPTSWPIRSVEGAGGHGYLVGDPYRRPGDWHETNQIIRGDLNDLVTRNGVDNTTPLVARLGADDRALPEKAAALCKVPMASLTNFRLWLAGATLEDSFYQAMGLSDLAPDKVLSAKAQAAGVPLFSEFAVKDDVVTWFGTMSPEGPSVSTLYPRRGSCVPGARKVDLHRLGARRFPASDTHCHPHKATLSRTL